MKGKSGLMVGVAAIALMATGQTGAVAASASASSGPSNAELAARLQAVEDELAADEAKADTEHSRVSTLEQNFNDTSWSFDNARPTVKSGDGRFTMAFRVRFQADWANFMQDTTHGAGPGPSNVAWGGKGDLASGAVIRRAYFGVEGRAFKDFWYELRFNGGGSDGGNAGSSGVPNAGEGDPLVNKAVITYTGIDHFHINVGVIEPNFMFEGTTSSAWLTFLERPEIDNIAADSFGAGDSRRGVEMNWQKTDTLWPGDNLNATIAYTGAKTGSSAGHGNGGDEQSQLLGRLSERLWTDGTSNLQIGGSASNDFYSGGATNGAGVIQLRDRPEIRVDGTRLIDTTALTAKHAFMWAVDAGMNYENFFLGGEYSHFQVDCQFVGCGSSGGSAGEHPSFSGWYVEGSWFLTGETRQYSPSALNNEVGGWEGPSAIASPFSLDGDSWGAWEVAARYSDTDLNYQYHNTAIGIPGGREGIIDLALNWYLNKDIRLMLDDQIVHLSKQSKPGVLGAAGIAPQGQDLNIVGVRLQFAN